ncbi:MAG: flagellar basal-body rod protein FlgF [Pseudomonadota bacterium]
MDRALFIAMTGADATMTRQNTISQNLANASSTGYRSQSVAFRSLPVFWQQLPTRAYAVETTTGSNFTPGVLKETGRSLDVALQGKGWFAVQDVQGAEAYTRAGHLQLDATGTIKTATGLVVLGETGIPLTVPEGRGVAIGRDGTVEAVNPSNSADRQTIGRIKLTNPAEASLDRGNDGLFRVKDGQPATSANNEVSITAGSLESSNVNVVESLVQMISAARQFETQLKVMQDLEADSRASTQLLTLS